VVSNQLRTVTQERDELEEQAKLHSTRSAYHEQLVRARESDLQDIRTAYEVGRPGVAPLAFRWAHARPACGGLRAFRGAWCWGISG
jgi:hypothetical protein